MWVCVEFTDLPLPRVWCNMGLVLRCKVLGVPTIWMTGTCSEKAGMVYNGLGEENE